MSLVGMPLGNVIISRASREGIGHMAAWHSVFAELFNWHLFLFGEDDRYFVFEVMVRSVIMFLISMATMRVLGKRGIKQGVFEVVVIITLGSAAGDAMFYRKVGLVPASMVFVMIILLYKLTNYLVAQSPWVQGIIEGSPLRLVEEGQFYYAEINKQTMAQDEYLPDLRLHGVTQLGQVRHAFIEASGEVSVVFYRDDDVRYGLPILPEIYDSKRTTIVDPATYACVYCGNTENLEPVPVQACSICHHTRWVKASNERRVL
jgi:uncharacterized membrane protein YcaP (DUF421 family)